MQNRRLSAVHTENPDIASALLKLRLDSYADFEHDEDFRIDPATFAAVLQRAATSMGWRIRTSVTAHGVFAEVVTLGRTAEVQHRDSDADLLRYLRRASEHVSGAPLSEGGYERVRGELGGAAASTIVRRLGPWASACKMAGVAAASSAVRVGGRVWRRELVVGAVADYLMGCGVAPTASGYGEWARHRAAAPGTAAIVAHGGWTLIRSLAEQLVDDRRSALAA